MPILLYYNHISYVNPILGVSFETSSDSLIDQIPSALGVFAEAVEGFIRVPSNQVKIMSSDSSEFSLIMLSCLSRFVCKLIISGVAAVSQIILYGWVQLLPRDSLVTGG